MPACPRCHTPVPDGARFCASCGAAVSPQESASLMGITADAPAARPSPRLDTDGMKRDQASTPGSRLTNLSGSRVERFAPGHVVGERFRIIELLGKGGMGEVYRADDLTLGEPVALKFLPTALSSDPSRVQRLLEEVRVARQISHPGVCRVYDVHTLSPAAQGEPPTVFLAMEFIDGEDLGSLLRRIGRLPRDKALEVARQVCAGIAAAHDMGVIHRDIKPSNIMIDGRGRARVTDFGLAGTLDRLSHEPGAGTPAYMAPEQLNGHPATARSDIYAIGLVLYELFTGRAAFKASSVAELRGLHATSDAARPSTVVDDIDPVVERVILRCLEKDPAYRPATALSVSAALPGGDPLTAALAAGETPSPEMVAASGSGSAVHPVQAMWCVLGFIAALGLLITLKSWTSMLRWVPFELSSEVLTARARGVLRDVGVRAEGGDWAWGWQASNALLSDIESNLDSRDRWEALRLKRRPTMQFWYRRSESVMVPTDAIGTRVGLNDPPMVEPGSARVILDSSGVLWRFDTVPVPDRLPADPHAPAPPSTARVDWGAFFRAAELDMETFKPAEPMSVPLSGCDSRESWTGELPSEGAFSPVPVRVEAASFRGQPVLFQIVSPWSLKAQSGGGGASVAWGAGAIVDAATYVFALTIGPFMAWRHIRSGRGDRRGALRLAVFVFVTTWLSLILGASRLGSVFQMQVLKEPVAEALWRAMLCWVLYMAAEPMIRRIRPWSVLGWSRFMGGRFSDPQVGRELLVGALIAAGMNIISLTVRHFSTWVGGLPAMPELPGFNWLGSARLTLAMVLAACGQAMFVPIYATVIHVALRWLTRSDRAAALLLWLLGSALTSRDFSSTWHGLVAGALMAGIGVFALVRYGLLAMGAVILCNTLMRSPPATVDLSAWYAPLWIAPYALVVVVVAWSAYAAAGGRGGVATLMARAAGRAA